MKFDAWVGRHWRGLAAITILAVGVFFAAAIVSTANDSIGDPAVIARIQDEDSCTELQREFDTAADNADRIHEYGGDASVPMRYMRVADDRLREIGCYG